MMVFIQRMALLAMLLLVLSACAVMDLSSQSTAIPLAPKSFETTMYQGIGLDLNSVVNTGLDLNENEGAQGDYSTGVKYAYSASPKTDIVGRIYISGYGFSWGAKLGVKYLLKQKGNHYLAIVPVATIVRKIHGDRGTTDDDHDDDFEYSSMGLENQLLSSWVLGKASTATLGGRVNISSFNKTEVGVHYGPYVLIHGGVFGNMRFGSKTIHLMPELGVELVPVIDGKLSWFPIMSLGLGLTF